MRTGKAGKFEIVDSATKESSFDPAVAAADRRWTSVGQDEAKSELFDRKARSNAAAYQRNIESYIGTVNIPLGIAGGLPSLMGRATPAFPLGWVPRMLSPSGSHDEEGVHRVAEVDRLEMRKAGGLGPFQQQAFVESQRPEPRTTRR